MPNPCPSSAISTPWLISKKGGHDINVSTGYERLFRSSNRTSLIMSVFTTQKFSNEEEHTVDAQLAVSNNLLNLSLLLQIRQTSPREGAVDL